MCNRKDINFSLRLETPSPSNSTHSVFLKTSNSLQWSVRSKFFATISLLTGKTHFFALVINQPLINFHFVAAAKFFSISSFLTKRIEAIDDYESSTFFTILFDWLQSNHDPIEFLFYLVKPFLLIRWYSSVSPIKFFASVKLLNVLFGFLSTCFYTIL